MEIRRLLYFARIAEDGSLTRAAGVLRVAQPALSRQLRLLEEELGVTLFTRTARGMRLTDEGRSLHEATTGPLRALEMALQNVRSPAAGISGDLAIGMPSSLADILATRFVRRMNADFPHIRLRVIEGPTGSLIDWLNRGIIDFALVEEASRDDRLIDMPLLSAPLMLVGGPASGLEPDCPVPFRRAAKLPLIVPSHHMGIRAAINRAAMKARITPSIRLESDNLRLILDMVADDAGHAFAPALLIDDRLRAGHVRIAPVVSPGLTFEILLTTRRRGQALASRLDDSIPSVLAAILSECHARTVAPR